MPDTSPAIKPAATVVLLKQTEEGLRILMLKRNSKLAFAGGFWVFPGGGLEQVDYEGNGNDIVKAVKAAAIRETKEEAGIEINTIDLIDLSHWTTPDIAPKRYSTWFLVGELSSDEPIIIDDEEIKNYAWVSAQQMLDKHKKKEIELLPPTYITLHEISRFLTAEQTLDFFSKRQPPVFLPKVCLQKKSVVFLYEGDSGYETADAQLDERKHRFYMGENKGTYHCELD